MWENQRNEIWVQQCITTSGQKYYDENGIHLNNYDKMVVWIIGCHMRVLKLNIWERWIYIHGYDARVWEVLPIECVVTSSNNYINNQSIYNTFWKELLREFINMNYSHNKAYICLCLFGFQEHWSWVDNCVLIGPKYL